MRSDTPFSRYQRDSSWLNNATGYPIISKINYLYSGANATELKTVKLSITPSGSISIRHHRCLSSILFKSPVSITLNSF